MGLRLLLTYMLSELRSGLVDLAEQEVCVEVNYYLKDAEMGIVFHGDIECRLVIGVRLGEVFNLVKSLT